MLDIATLKVGTKVFYRPSHDKGLVENGMVKEIPDHTTEEVRVVYHCGGDWKNFKDYTSALTPVANLFLGWCHENVKEECDHLFLPFGGSLSPASMVKCCLCGEIRE
jgi:hypothetical protein